MKRLGRLVRHVLLLLGLCSEAAAAGSKPPRLAWVPPSTLRAVRLGGPAATQATTLDPAEPATLAPGVALLVPAAPGDFLRVEGADLELGLGSGVLELPDVVTWLSREPGSVHELTIPTWGSTRELVVRGTGGRAATVRVLTSSPLRRPVRYYRADEAVERLIWDGAEPPSFAGELEEEATELRRLLAVRALLGSSAETESGRAFLQAEWLEASLRERPMDAPFVKPVPVVLSGGKVATEDDLSSLDPTLEHRLVGAGERVVISSERAGVVSLLVRLRAVGRSLVRVWEGDTLRETIVVEIPRQAENPKRWAPSQFARLVVGRSASLRVEVERGNALVSLRGYRLRTSVLDRRHVRDREDLLERSVQLAPAGAAGAALRALATFARTRSRADAEALFRLSGDPSLASGARVLLLEQLARHPTTATEGARALGGLFALTTALPAGLALPLRRSGLHAAWRAGFTLPPDTLAPLTAPRPEEVGLAEDALVVEATSELVTLPQDGARPTVSNRVDRLLVGDAPRDDIERLARASFRTTAPWTWVDPVEELGMVIRLRPLYDRLADEPCAADTPDGLRWLLIDRTPLELTLAPGPGSHVRVPVRSEVEVARPEAHLLVDDVGLAVHTGAALTSIVAVKPGRHRFVVESGSPVLVRAPVAETLPCGRLREVERWVRVEKTAHFRLPGPGVASAASILVESDSMQGQKRELDVRVGAERHHGWFHSGATGALEVPVPAAADELELTVDRPALLRVRLRLHPKPVRARVVRPSSLEPPKDAAEMLEAVRAATRYLRIALDFEGRRALRLARAKALDALGYTRLAALDRARAGVPEEPEDEEESPDYVELPETSPAVVPLGSFAKIPPLPLPASGPLELTLAAKSRGEAPPALLAVLGTSADASSSADALLLADLAERTGAIRPAALAYRRIGEAHDSGEALSRAAALYTDVALAEDDKNLGLEAYLLARRAEEHGASAGAALGRLDAAIAWQRVQAGSAAGVTRLEEARVRVGEPTQYEAVRSALLDAPPLARLFGGPELRLGVERVRGQAIELESTCHALEGPDEPCDYRVELDGERAECVPVEEVSTADGVTRPKRCRVKLPLGARGLRVIAPASDSIGTVDAHRIEDGDPVPLTVVSSWDEALPDRPVRFSLLGPTVLRLTARGYAGKVGALVSRIRKVAPGEEYQEQRFELEPEPDGFAERVEGRGKVTRPRTVFVAVPGTGPHEVSIAGTERLLLRIERANAVGLPAPKRKAETTPVVAPPGAPRVAGERLSPPAVGFDPEPGPLTVGGYALALSGELVEGDAEQGATYVELGAQARRALVPGRLWVLAGPFARLRAGPASFGGRASLHFQHDGVIPGAFARGRFVAQDALGGVHQGYYAGFGVFDAIDLSSELELAPRVALTLRGTADDARRLHGVDPDVYTRYAAEHPWSVDVSTALTHRLAVDALVRAGAVARLLPNFDGVDWVDLSLLGLAAPGRNHAPEARLQLSASYRPRGLYRAERYVRLLIEPSVLLWHFAGDTRLAGGAAFGYAHDFPENGHGNAFAFQLLLAGDYTFGRGLDDFSPSELVFRPRAEEGADVPVRAAPRANPYAAEPQE